MKARVKETGEIIDVIPFNRDGFAYIQDDGETVYEFHELEILDEPYYWTRLEHQYAGMAMQGISEKYFKEYRDYCAGFGDMDEDEAKGAMEDFANAMADVCYHFAHALVEKMKEEK